MEPGRIAARLDSNYQHNLLRNKDKGSPSLTLAILSLDSDLMFLEHKQTKGANTVQVKTRKVTSRTIRFSDCRIIW